MSNKFEIICDTREQLPLVFENECIINVVHKKLVTGDYSIVGKEDLLCIERKASLLEFYNNVAEKRFWAEMDRMNHQFKFIVMEFPLSDIQSFPYSLGVDKSVWSKLTMTPQFLMSCVAKLQVNYGINVIFADNRDLATDVIINIMRKVNAIT